MIISGSATVESAGISMRIVDFLDKFPFGVPIDFLAQELGRRPEKLMDELSLLENQKIVSVDREKMQVSLIREEKRFRIGHIFQTLSGSK